MIESTHKLIKLVKYYKLTSVMDAILSAVLTGLPKLKQEAHEYSLKVVAVV